MKINSPTLEYSNGRAILSARVELGKPLQNYPDRLWFSVPEKFGVALSDRADGFLVSLLTPAMFLGEDIQVEGIVSQRLLYFLPEIQYYLMETWPKIFNQVNIFTSIQKPQEYSTNRNWVLMNFSGGIDSQYTLYSHLPAKQPVREH